MFMMTGPEVSLEEILRAREARAGRQRELLRRGTALISFSMNIAGPVKYTPLIRRGFLEGCAALESALGQARLTVLERERSFRPTGCEGFWLLRADPMVLKRLTAEIEDTHPLGRLFDLDVLGEDGRHISRTGLGAPDRECLVCGAPGRACASRRLHPVEEIQRKIREMLEDFFLKEDLEQIASLCGRALLYEVCTTPKPGLVDCENNGSHRDMNLFHFLDSTAGLFPFFRDCAEIGYRTRLAPPAQAFGELRTAGKAAERRMLAATGGVNTHKGAIFSMGAVCGAMGRLRREEGLCRNPAVILDTAAALVREAAEGDLAAIRRGTAVTAGGEQYVRYGLTGVRGQAAGGFPAVRKIGLPVLRKGIRAGKSLPEAGTAVLLHLVAAVEDTNLIARGGCPLQQETAARLRALLAETPFPDAGCLRDLNAWFVERNLSPGGCADLLAITYLLYFTEEAGGDTHCVEQPFQTAESMG